MGQLIELPIRRVTPEVVAGTNQAVDSFMAFAMPSPVSSRRLELEIPVGASVADVIKAFGIPADSEARVCINDRIVAVDERASVFPKAGDVVTVRVIPGSISASLAATLVGWGLSASVAATVASVTVTAVVGAVTSLLGKLLTMALAPPSNSGGPKVSATPLQFSVSGKQNVAAPFSVIPKPYGTRRLSPQYAATPYIELVGGDQYLRMLLMLGYGPMDISQLQIKDSPLDGFQDVEWEIRAGFPDDSPPRLYPGSVVENDISVVLNSDHSASVPTTAGEQVETSGQLADELSVVVQFLNGFSATDATNGDAVWIQMHLKIRWGPTGTMPGSAGWVNEPDIVLSSHGKGHVRRGHTWRVPRGQYDVGVQVLHFAAANGNWSNLIYQAVCTWTSLTTIRAQAPFAMGGLAMIALRIRASRQLNGVIDSLNCIASSILPDYNATLGVWNDRAGAWSYDYDNAGAGAAFYQLDAANARTTAAVTGKRFITDVQMGVADSVTTAFSSAGLGGGAPFTQLPIQPGSLIISVGTKANVTSGPGSRKKSAGVTTEPFISDDGQGGIVGPTVTSGTINYATGAWTMTFSIAPGGGDNPTADFVQLIKTPGAGRALAIKTVSGSADGAAVVSKSVPSKIIRHNDSSTGAIKVFTYAVSGWYKASAAIAAGIRVRVLFGATEDFAESAATSATDILSNAAATMAYQQFSQVITIPAPPNADWMRLALYHNPDGVGGVTVFFDDCSVMVTDQGPTALELLSNPSFDFPGRITSNPASHYRDTLQGPANKQPLPDARIDVARLQSFWTNCNTNSRFNNSILDQPGTIFDVLKNIAAIGRAAYQLRDGLYSVVQDIPQSTIVQHFTPRNSWGFRGTFAFPNLPQALRVRWTNPQNDWQPDERIVYDDGTFSVPAPVATPTLAGSTDLGQSSGVDGTTVAYDISGLSPMDGDRVVIFTQSTCTSVPSMTPPSDYATVDSIQFAHGAAYVFTHVWRTGDTTSPTFTRHVAGGGPAGNIVRAYAVLLRPSSGTVPVAVDSFAHSTVTASSIPSSSLTPQGLSEMYFVLYGANSSHDAPWTGPPTLTTLFSAGSGPGLEDVLLAYGVFSGATGTYTAGITSSEPMSQISVLFWVPDLPPVIITLPYTAGTLPPNPLYETLDLTNSVTDIDQAWREGRFHLAQGRLRPQVYQLNCDIENLIAQRGDLIRVTHDLIAQGLGYARVKSVTLDGSNNCLGVTLDEPSLAMNYGSAYALRFRKSTDGSGLLENLTNTAASIAPTLSSASSAEWATMRVAISGARTQPSVRSSAVGPTGTASTAAVTMPAGSLAGDLLLAHLKFDSNPGTILPPTGWALLSQLSDPTLMEYEAVFYKLSNGSEPGTYTFNWSNSVPFASGSVCVTDNSGDAPIDATASKGFVPATSAAAPYPAAQTPALDLILVFAAQKAAATLSLTGATAVYTPANAGFGCWQHPPAFAVGAAFTFATPIPAANPQPQAGDLAMYGLQGSESGQFLITKIEPGQDLSAIITFVDYAPGVYTADATPPTQASQTLAAPGVEAPVIASIDSDDQHVAKATAGRVVISLTPPQSMLTNAGAIVSIEYQIRVSNTHGLNAAGAYSGATTYNTGDMVTSGGQSWVSIVDSNVGVTPGTDGSKWTLLDSTLPWSTPARVPFSEQVIIDNVEPKTIYDIQLRYIYKDGTFSDWSLETAYTVMGQVTGPPDVTGLTATEPSTGIVRLSWMPVAVKNVATYEVRVGASWAAGGPAPGIAQTNSTDYKDHGVAPGTYTYWVGVLDTSGNYDANPASVAITVV